MSQLKQFAKELEEEGVTTRKMLSIIPDDRYDWKPHPKSMTIRQLATHIAELPSWPGMALNTDELDFLTMEQETPEINDTKSLLELFEKNLEDGKTQLAKGKEDTLHQAWTLRSGEKIHSREPKSDVIRMSISQTIHHRAQLGVFLRLLDVPIPGSYGPSADDTDF